jgi:hypothetical protein
MTATHPKSPADRRRPIVWSDQKGIAGGCLIAIVIVVIIFVGGGIYVAENYRVWAAKGITFAMTAVINESDLPGQEKAEIANILALVKENYIAGDVTLEELGTILEAMANCPAIAVGMVVQFEASYVTPSALRDDEKAFARLHLNRFAQGLNNDAIGWGQLDEVTEPILQVSREQKRDLKPPGQCSPDEIRQVLQNVKTAADQQNIPMRFVDIDISDEFIKTIEGALGRELHQPAGNRSLSYHR